MKNNYQDNYQELFSYMIQNHGVTLLQTEMEDLIDVVEKSRWIKIEDELPPIECYVIGYVLPKCGKTKKSVAEVYLTKSQKWLMEENYECIVTHWMPLPDPPNE